MYDSEVVETGEHVPAETIARHGKRQILLFNFQGMFL